MCIRIAFIINLISTIEFGFHQLLCDSCWKHLLPYIPTACLFSCLLILSTSNKNATLMNKKQLHTKCLHVSFRGTEPIVRGVTSNFRTRFFLVRALNSPRDHHIAFPTRRQFNREKNSYINVRVNVWVDRERSESNLP